MILCVSLVSWVLWLHQWRQPVWGCVWEVWSCPRDGAVPRLDEQGQGYWLDGIFQVVVHLIVMVCWSLDKLGRENRIETG